jgi:hypothetical protein
LVGIPGSGSVQKCHGSTTLVPPYLLVYFHPAFTAVLLYPSRVVCSRQPVSCAYYAWFNQSLTLLPARLSTGSSIFWTPFTRPLHSSLFSLPTCTGRGFRYTMCHSILYHYQMPDGRKTNPVLWIRIRIDFCIRIQMGKVAHKKVIVMQCVVCFSVAWSFFV